MKLQISPLAEQQLTELANWWDENRPTARIRVEDAFAEALNAISQHPKLGKTYNQRSIYRTWRLKGTPYYLFYQVDEKAGLIKVAAVWSGIRGEGPPLG